MWNPNEAVQQIVAADGARELCSRAPQLNDSALDGPSSALGELDMQGLRLTFEDDGDGTGKLLAEIHADGFAARGAAWFDEFELRRFAYALRAFPLAAGTTTKIAGGFYSKSSPLRLEHVLLSLEAYPVGSRGQVGIRVHAETEVWPGDREEARNQATVEMLTTYARLSDFSHELVGVLEKKLGEAVIEVERLSRPPNKPLQLTAHASYARAGRS